MLLFAVGLTAGAADLSREIFKELIEINTSYTTGSTTPAAEAMAKRLRAAGWSEADLFVGGASPKKANLVARYRGTGARKPVLLLAHLDVVEARREDWSLDPFKLVEKDGYFYGRGTSDDKAQAAIWVANLIRYKQEGWKPDRDLILALTADEEGGGPYNGVQWLLAQRKDLIGDAEFCLNEGGWGEMVNGQRRTNNIQVSEKYVVNYRLEVRNKGGHSSMPVEDNAIYRLSAALGRIAAFGFPLKTNEVTRAYFERIATMDAGPRSSDLAKVAQGDQQAMARVAAASPVWNATLRTTCVATQLEGGHARNALPQLAAANVNCRVMPDESTESVTATLRRAVTDEQVSIQVDGEVNKGPASPLRADVMGGVAKITDSMWPGIKTVPIMVMGATDGLYLRAAGIPTYGVQGIFMERDDFRAHGRDERLAVQSFDEGARFLDRLVRMLAAADARP
jgi:acetylornithine deacetylase/succinyl-diaminopimelate desuccinylase-like protein